MYTSIRYFYEYVDEVEENIRRRDVIKSIGGLFSWVGLGAETLVRAKRRFYSHFFSFVDFDDAFKSATSKKKSKKILLIE